MTGYKFGAAEKGTMNSNGALVVSTNQPKGKMVKVLFEPDAKLSEPLTYDITAWNIPYAYGLDGVASETLVSASPKNMNKATLNTNNNAAGYIAKWNSIQDAAFLSELLQQGINVRFSEKKLRFGGNDFDRGSLIITKSDNRNNPDFNKMLNEIALKHNRSLYASNTSFGDTLTDFGSPDVKMINAPKIAMLRGDGVSSLSYGATWHFFETQLNYPVTHIDTDDFNTRTLAKYNVLVMPEGWYSKMLNEDTLKGLQQWIRSGGKVIAIGAAGRSFEGKDGFDLKNNEEDKKEDVANTPKGNLIPYDQRERESVDNFITGSIYKVTLDPSHPMAFGYGDTYYSLKQGSTSYQFLEDGYNVGYIKDDAVSVSGFSGKSAKEKLKNSMIFGEARMGGGSIIYLVDDVLFRSFWENGKLFIANSIFFVNNNKFTL